jgi:hypothetical protein
MGTESQGSKAIILPTRTITSRGCWITREGRMPVPKKVQALMNIGVSTNVKEPRSFIELVNYYRYMWIRRSDVVLAPLTKLVSKNQE